MITGHLVFIPALELIVTLCQYGGDGNDYDVPIAVVIVKPSDENKKDSDSMLKL